MEERNDIHFEIQCESSRGEWVELLEERPKTEEEISRLCDRARAKYPGKKIRAVKVTTTIAVENLSEVHRTGIPAPEAEQELQYQNRVHELLQDCD